MRINAAVFPQIFQWKTCGKGKKCFKIVANLREYRP